MWSTFNKNKRDELLIYTAEHKIDIVGLTETWSTADIFNSELDIPRFNFYRRDRNNTLKCKGKGVALYIMDKLVSGRHEVLPNKEC